MTHCSLHCVSSTVKTSFHAKYFQASMQQNQGCSTGRKELGAEGDHSIGSALTSLAALQSDGLGRAGAANRTH